MEETKDVRTELEKELLRELEKMKNLHPGTEPYSLAAESFERMYKLRVEDAKIDAKFEELRVDEIKNENERVSQEQKNENDRIRNENERISQEQKNENDRIRNENEAKRTEVDNLRNKNEAKNNKTRNCIEAGKAVTQLSFAAWAIRTGLKFEETNILGRSGIVRQVLSKCIPFLKW